jgi:hypothetical protein
MYENMVSESDMKMLITGKHESSETNWLQRDWNLLFKTLLLSSLFYGAYLVSCEIFDPPSRRLCNFSFVMYHCSAVLAGMATGMVQELLLKQKQTNILEDVISYN